MQWVPFSVFYRDADLYVSLLDITLLTFRLTEDERWHISAEVRTEKPPGVCRTGRETNCGHPQDMHMLHLPATFRI